MKWIHWLWPLAILVSLTASAACSGGDNSDSTAARSGSPPSATSSPQPLDGETSAGFERWTSERYRYTVEIPIDWVAIPDFPVELEGQTYYADVFQGPLVNNFTLNINIGGSPTGGFTADQMYAVEIGRARDIHDDLVVEDITIAGKPPNFFTMWGANYRPKSHSTHRK